MDSRWRENSCPPCCSAKLNAAHFSFRHASWKTLSLRRSYPLPFLSRQSPRQLTKPLLKHFILMDVYADLMSSLIVPVNKSVQIALTCSSIGINSNTSRLLNEEVSLRSLRCSFKDLRLI